MFILGSSSRNISKVNNESREGFHRQSYWSQVHYGMPVEPGNLMLLAYRGQVPIVGLPGCAKSKSYNVVDMVLPRLVAGERLTRRDLLELGHGGLIA